MTSSRSMGDVSHSRLAEFPFGYCLTQESEGLEVKQMREKGACKRK